MRQKMVDGNVAQAKKNNNKTNKKETTQSETRMQEQLKLHREYKA